ncbi:hypothetical protein TNIN_216111 [Trichonephila inaurata madagascariensis]|uniref:Uncharacterized protein n=1 Tax=Trichonephila inaurata madagascariensis TaxID=2747483 RepID=A0A8X6YFE8_9ARAC|nr:hypothetical protein TNIN_216111 [Trichonephila inaurata madagascariensis]
MPLVASSENRQVLMLRDHLKLPCGTLSARNSLAWKRCCLVDRVKSWETVFSTLTSILLVLAHIARLSRKLFKESSKGRMLLPVAHNTPSSAKKRQETPGTF